MMQQIILYFSTNGVVNSIKTSI